MEEKKITGSITANFKEDKLSKESATQIFDEILEFYDYDFSDIEIDQGEEGAKTIRNKLIRAIMKGRIETNMHEDPKKGFQIIQHCLDGTTVTYNEYSSKAVKNAAKISDPIARNYALLGVLCGQGEDRIDKMRGPDAKMAENIAVLFLL